MISHRTPNPSSPHSTANKPTLRGAEITALYERFQQPHEATEENRALQARLKLALQEETRDVAEEYALYLQEYVHVSPALRNATLAPTNPEWRSIIRHEYTLDRLIERKLKLLMQVQKARRARERAARARENDAHEKKEFFFTQTKLGSH